MQAQQMLSDRGLAQLGMPTPQLSSIQWASTGAQHIFAKFGHCQVHVNCILDGQHMFADMNTAQLDSIHLEGMWAPHKVTDMWMSHGFVTSS